MTLKRQLLFSITYILTVISMSGCSIGMLLFYRDSKTRTVYKSSESNQNYYIVNATTLSHCGCTDLHIESYKNGKKEFNLFYNGNIARKTIYKFDSNTNQRDTMRLVATPNTNYTTPFDSLDIEIFNRIDSIAIQKPTGIVYPIKRPAYKGFISDPYYSQREL